MAYTIDYTGMEQEGKMAVISYNYNGKPAEKKIPSWTERGKAIIKLLKSAEAGDKFSVQTDKENGFVVWSALTPLSGEAQNVAATAVSEAVNQNTTRAYYGESPTERAQRQLYIIKQSSLSNALTLLTHNNKDGTLSTAEVIALADTFTTWVLEKNFDDGEEE